MTQLPGIIILLPFIGFIVLALAGRSMKKAFSGLIGAGSVGISAILTIILGILYLSEESRSYTVELWQWLNIAGLSVDFSLQIDSLSMVFIFVISFVGFLIHLYSVDFMRDEEGYSRFFAYMNLFIGSMLLLVLADNLILLYIGWEGVGICSFLLIGFWYKIPENNAAARKAFIVTRIGDAALIIGLFLLFLQFRTLSISEIIQEIPGVWKSGSPVANAAALLILGGAAGKSAQLPLQTWLPDAMAGPTPVSALIHAATMVAAGVYLIARTHTIFIFSPVALKIVAIIGAATLLIAGVSALAQYDIKKILAYSTISQIGYMFLGLGVGAWSAAIFHFMVHAFFKALLFLAAGTIILAMDHEHDIFKMGGLRKKMPWTFWTFLAGAASLAALPLITAGFYSKDQILFYVLQSGKGNLVLWLAGIAGAFITAVYTFRMVFVTFYGEGKREVHNLPGIRTKMVLSTLAFFSIAAGFINMPHGLGDFKLFSGFLSPVLPHAETTSAGNTGVYLILLNSVLVLAGIYIAYYAFVKQASKTGKYSVFSRDDFPFLRSGFGFDRFYHIFIVRPFEKLAATNRNDFIDSFYSGIARFTVWLNGKATLSQTGRLSWYLMVFTIGSILIITLILTV